MDGLNSLLNNPLILIFLVGFLGIILGRIGTKHVKLGAAAALIVGVFFGHFGYTVSNIFFNISVTMFIAPVGLLASRDVVRLLKRYGARLPFLAIIITFAGASIVYIMALLFRGLSNPIGMAGSYTGALTSSPGLLAALEATGNNPLISVAYTLTYLPGMLNVVFFIQYVPRLFRINVEQEKLGFEGDFRGTKEADKPDEGADVVFSVFALFLAIITGLVLGEIRVSMPYIGNINLGAAGGVIITSLVVGYFGEKLGKIGNIPVGVAPRPLAAIRDTMLPFGMAAVGLSSGSGFVAMFLKEGMFLMMVSLVTGFFSLFIGFILGRYIFHMNWTVLAGTLCGGMTSTPGLAVAIDSVKSEAVGIGYGAAYPVGVVCKVFFTKLLLALLVQ
jgi:putative transport protein